MEEKIGIIGSGSWATALAKVMLENAPEIHWYMRSNESIAAFEESGHNPRYLTYARFDTSRIHFSSDINEVVSKSDILIIAVPSPYVKQVLMKIKRSMRKKTIVSAVKGMIADEQVLVTDWIRKRFQVEEGHIAIIAGPCHAEEIAMERLSYLTIGCTCRELAVHLCQLIENRYVHTTPSTDVDGLEYSSVMKNIYAIAAGLCHTLSYGDNFQAVLLSNAMQEIQRFTMAMQGGHRDTNNSGYLGDVLVTAYSQYSRNRQFGQMIGMGYSVKSAQLEMQMVAEGYYGTLCIHQLNEKMKVSLPIVDAVYAIIYERQSPLIVIQKLTQQLR